MVMANCFVKTVPVTPDMKASGTKYRDELSTRWQ